MITCLTIDKKRVQTEHNYIPGFQQIHERLKRGNKMTNHKQNQISINDTVEQNCPKCLGQYFDIVTKLRIFSKLNPKNSSGKDVLIKVEVYLCRDCKHEYGQPIVQGSKKPN